MLGCLLMSVRTVKWSVVLLGALVADIAAMIVGGSTVVFWGLLMAAAVILSLRSLPRAAVLAAAAFLVLRLDIEPAVYVSLFLGVIWSGILLFTSETNCAIMKDNDKLERNRLPWQENPTTTKA
ncbi:MAG: hypothetical protein J1F63_06885 [Oscillospiraceae bacterium]|nr:hypothetical protein [Oscillospiraceae bacterium]